MLGRPKGTMAYRVFLQNKSIYVPQLCGLGPYGWKICLFCIPILLGPCLIWFIKSILHPSTFLFGRAVPGRPTVPRVRPRHGLAVGQGWHRHDPKSGRAVFGPGQNGVPWARPWASGHIAIYIMKYPYYSNLLNLTTKIKQYMQLSSYCCWLFVA